MEIPELCTLYRALNVLTVAQAAAEFNISRQTWHRWESGAAPKLPDEALWRLRTACGILAEAPLTLRDIRKTRRLYADSIKPVYGLIGVTRQTWHRWETGQGKPSHKHAAEIRRLLRNKNNCEI